jgi:hypothetical protein
MLSRLNKLACLFLLVHCQILYSQNSLINKGEYFFDNDPGYGNGFDLPVTIEDSVEISGLIPVEGLSSGFHQICFRFQNDSGLWSQNTCKSFILTNSYGFNVFEIAEAEYFIDSDPGLGNATSIEVSNLDTLDFMENLDLSAFSLSYGFHTICLRFKDLSGLWSHSTCRSFIYSKQNLNDIQFITEAEYFIDSDPGIGNGTAIELDNTDTLDFAESLDLSSFELNSGFHTLCFRFKDESGSWSHSTCRSFIYSEQNLNDIQFISEAEYFIDSDPGIGNGTVIELANTDTLNFEESLDLSAFDLDYGFHTICFRFKDESGLWSHSTCRSFTFQPSSQNETELIVAAEYFFDSR